jgi:GntR family transcriptional regulator/MocR family aminotransferase
VALDRSQRDPLREQLAEQVRAAVLDGRLRAGVRLPASRVLAGELGVSRGVVVDAYEELRAQGFLRVAPRSAPVVAAVPGAGAPREPEPATRAPLLDVTPESIDPALFDRRGWLRAYSTALGGASARVLDGGDLRGQASLRAALADYLGRTRGVVADPAQLVVCQGSTQAFALVGQLLAAIGVRRIAVEDPGPPQARAAASRAGLEVAPLPVDRDGASSDAIEVAGAQAVLLTPGHQLPTGALLAPPRRRAILAWAQRADGVIVEYDHDGDLRGDAGSPGALQASDTQRVIYVGTASRALVPGLRLGWALVPASLREQAAAIRAELGGPSPALDQLAFARLLRSAAFERHVRYVRAEYARRREAMLAALGGGRALGDGGGVHLRLPLPDPIDHAALAASASAHRLRVRSLESYRQVPPPEVRELLVGYGRVPTAAAPLAAALLDRVIAGAAAGTASRPRW